MRPVIALEAAIAQLREIPAGAGVGYGLTFRRARDTDRHRSRGLCRWPAALPWQPGRLLDRGVRAPIVGRVSMDSITLDVTDVPGEALYPGAPVELIGPHQTLDHSGRRCGHHFL
jgi:alanine racemase